MTTFYCDYESGNDAAAGTSFATRWKTLTNGATSSRIAPGDTIRLKASPDPTGLGQTATWTDGPLPATFVPTSSTNATPIVFTKVGHGLVTGDTVIVRSHTTNTNANGVWEVAVSGDTFTILNADGSNSVGNGVGGATGTVRKITNSVVKLSTPVTQNIASFGNQDSAGKAAWTASANVTATVPTTDYKEGFGSQSIAIAAGFTTGLAAYFPTGTLDLSGYQQVSFNIKQSAGNLSANSSCSLALCSDATGTTVVNTINIPNLGGLSHWVPITVDLGAALGSSIQSIAFIVNTDNGAQTFYIDNIIACKASSAADSLSNTSLIGKNTGTEGWYGIQSINGTRVILDMGSNSIPTVSPSRGYSGTAEIVITYKRETIKTAMAADFTVIVQDITNSGSIELPITYSGGWNRTDMSTLTGETIFDGQNGFGRGITIANKSYINLSLSVVRYYYGIVVSENSFRNRLTLGGSTNNYSYGIAVGLGPIINPPRNNIIIARNTNNNSIGLFGLSTFTNNIVITNANNNSIAIDLQEGANNTIQLSNSANNSARSINCYPSCGHNYLKSSVLNSVAKVAIGPSGGNYFLWSTNENGNTDTHFGYTDGGLISSDVTMIHTAGGMSWKLSPTSANRSVSYPLPLKVAVGATAANTAITCNVWFRRDNTGLTARLICKGGQLTGVDSDVSTSMTAAANTWELLSVTVQPSQKGVLEFTAECWGGTTYNCWTDEPTFS